MRFGMPGFGESKGFGLSIALDPRKAPWEDPQKAGLTPVASSGLEHVPLKIVTHHTHH